MAVANRGTAKSWNTEKDISRRTRHSMRLNPEKIIRLAAKATPSIAHQELNKMTAGIKMMT